MVWVWSRTNCKTNQWQMRISCSLVHLYTWQISPLAQKKPQKRQENETHLHHSLERGTSSGLSLQLVCFVLHWKKKTSSLQNKQSLHLKCCSHQHFLKGWCLCVCFCRHTCPNDPKNAWMNIEYRYKQTQVRYAIKQLCF